MALLEVGGLHAGYGRTPVLLGVDLAINSGEIVALLGRNGVGKTTTLRSIVGLTTHYHGTIRFDGVQLERRPTHVITRAGIGFVPEDRGIFPGLTVEENLRLGRMAANNHAQLLHYDAVLSQFPVLRERLSQEASSLSGGERQMLALSRALLTQPRLLLVDEFSEGLQPNIVQQLTAKLTEIARLGVGFLLVEQNAQLALRLSTRCYIMEKGEIVDSGQSNQFVSDAERLRRHLVI